jgi:hypothetical protein
VDLKRDANNCGACGTACNMGTNPRCVDGVCMDTLCTGLNPPRTNCNNACLTDSELQRDPLNCGACGNACQTNEVCAAGQCQPYFPSPSCNACPCAACGATDRCCPYPGGPVICVAGNSCPN